MNGEALMTPVGPPVSILKQAPADGHALAAAAKKWDFGKSTCGSNANLHDFSVKGKVNEGK